MPTSPPTATRRVEDNAHQRSKQEQEETEEEEEDRKPKKAFSFFASADDIDLTDSDDSDTDDEDGDRKRTKKGDDGSDEGDDGGELAAKKSKAEALPSLDDLLSDKKLAKPTFLENQLTAKDVKTFDAREPEVAPTPWVKLPGQEKSAEQKAKQERKRAEQQAKADGVALEVMAAAHAFSSMYKSDTDKPAPSRPAPPRAQSADSAKEDSSKTFKAKEKRKRDIGQANRDKSWVEEEKRKLRESMPNMGFGFD